MKDALVDISVIIPVRNGAEFLGETLDALLVQENLNPGKSFSFEVCVYDDRSEDNTWEIIENYEAHFIEKGISFRKRKGQDGGGVGYAKNAAIALATGSYLCFNDADDISLPNRLSVLLTNSQRIHNECGHDLMFIGSKFKRLPDDSTLRYTKWANDMTKERIRMQVFTSHGPTLIAPTWYISTSLYKALPPFDNTPKGYPEDLKFFYNCLDLDDDRVVFEKVDEELVVYRYHSKCATHGVSEATIWDMRMERLKSEVLSKWPKFTIWSAGKQGKRFFKCLSEEEKQKVGAFCDVDVSKIKRGLHEEFDENSRKVTHRIPIVHVRDAQPPVVICVKQDMTDGDLEELIRRSGWVEERDYVHFG